jgi:hypothetical protein
MSEVKVIGAGWGRTGTSSIKLALETLLEGKCHHMREVLGGDERHRQLWRNLAKGEKVDLDELMAGFVASCDFPACNIWRELADHAPDAKVLLSVRDAASWQKSVLETIYFTRILYKESFGCTFFRTINRIINPGMVALVAWLDEYIWEQAFFKNGPVQSLQGEAGLALIKQRMVEWEQAVRSHIPSDRLLVFQVKEGWAPLCKLLNVPVPDTPFPNINDTEQFKREVFPMKIVWYGGPILFVSALLGGAAFAYFRFMS